MIADKEFDWLVAKAWRPISTKENWVWDHNYCFCVYWFVKNGTSLIFFGRLFALLLLFENNGFFVSICENWHKFMFGQKKISGSLISCANIFCGSVCEKWNKLDGFGQGLDQLADNKHYLCVTRLTCDTVRIQGWKLLANANYAPGWWRHYWFWH